MDILSEASDAGGRVLTARHISVEKAIPHANNHINTTVSCHDYGVEPDFNIYFTGNFINFCPLFRLLGYDNWGFSKCT